MSIGIVRATALVAGNMIGSGALLTPALLASFGSLALVGWGVTTIGALALALCFAKLSEWLPGAGGPYTYVRHVFGDFMGFQVSWCYWFSTWCGSASLVIGSLSYLSVFFPEVTANGLVSISLGLSMVWLFTLINMKGVTESTTVSVIILIVKVLPLALFAIVGIFFFEPTMAFRPINYELVKDLSFLSMAQPLLWAFIGLESATVPADSVENPKKTIPAATVIGVLITASIYIVGTIVIYGVLPENVLLNSKAPYVDAARYIAGNYGGLFMIGTGLIGLIGSLNGWILIHGQVPYAAAKDGLFPEFFAKKNKNGAPIGVFVGSVLMSILFLLSYRKSITQQIGLLIDLSVLAMLLPYFYCTIAAIYMAVSKKETLSCKHKIFLSITSTIAFVYSFVAILGSGKDILFYGFVVMLLSTPFYIFVKRQKQQSRNSNN